MGEPVSQVLQLYREAGLTMNEEFDALPDHIAAELEFMVYLIQQEAEAEDGEGWQERQKRFLAEHLLRWGGEFLEKLQDSARQPFYRYLAPLTEMWLRAEGQRLRMNAPHWLSIQGGKHGKGDVDRYRSMSGLQCLHSGVQTK
jgi:TorA maturation chaperone TorD